MFEATSHYFEPSNNVFKQYPYSFGHLRLGGSTGARLELDPFWDNGFNKLPVFGSACT
jgi:hypothetical protein